MKVKKEHLVGEIADFPLHIVQLMVDEQERQGEVADPSVFAADLWGGFVWNKSKQGHEFWRAVIHERHFDLIPESETRIQSDEEVKPKRKIIQISESITSDDRYASPWNLTALCDDGTVWVRSDGDWVRLPDIPQDGE